MKFIRLIILATFLFSTTHAKDGKLKKKWRELKKQLTWKNLKQKAVEGIAQLDVGFDVGHGENIPFIKKEGADFLAGMHTAVKYRYELEPSYVDDYFTRVDKWKLDVNLNATKILEGIDGPLPISLRLESGQEIHFVRQFKSQWKASKALPYGLKRLPFTAKNVKKNLIPGDYVSVPVKMNLVLSASLPIFKQIADVTAYSHFVVGGSFQIHVYRMKDNKARVKLFALNKKAKGFSLKGGYNLLFGKEDEEFEVTGVKWADSAIKGLTKMKLAELGFNWEKGTLFVLDYIFDLDDEDATKAYNDIFSSYYSFKTLEILNPFTKDKKVEEALLSCASNAEILFDEDKLLLPEERRVDRIFQGTNDYRKRDFNFKFDIKLLNFRANSAYTENHITYTDRYDQKQYYYYPNHTVNSKYEFMFGLHKEQNLWSSFALITCDEDRNPTSLAEYGIRQESTDKVLRKAEQEEIKTHLKRNLPFGIYDRIDFGDWKEVKKRKNARVSFQFILHKSAYEYLNNLTEDDYFRTLRNVVSTIPEPYREPEENDYHDERPSMSEMEKKALRACNMTNFASYFSSAKSMIKKLREIFSEEGFEDNYRKQLKRMVKLRSNSFFKMAGIGYLIALFKSEEALKKHAFISLELSAKNTNRLRFTHGDHAETAFYLELQYIQSILNNRSFDLRLRAKEEVFKELGKIEDEKISTTGEKSEVNSANVTSTDISMIEEQAEQNERLPLNASLSKNPVVAFSFLVDRTISVERRKLLAQDMIRQFSGFSEINNHFEKASELFNKLSRGEISEAELNQQLKNIADEINNTLAIPFADGSDKPVFYTPGIQQTPASNAVVLAAEVIRYRDELQRYIKGESDLATLKQFASEHFVTMKQLNQRQEENSDHAYEIKVLRYLSERILIAIGYTEKTYVSEFQLKEHFEDIHLLLCNFMVESRPKQVDWDEPHTENLLPDYLAGMALSNAFDPTVDKQQGLYSFAIQCLSKIQQTANASGTGDFSEKLSKLNETLLQWLTFTTAMEYRSFKMEKFVLELLPIIYKMNREFQAAWQMLEETQDVGTFCSNIRTISDRFKLQLLYPDKDISITPTPDKVTEQEPLDEDIIIRW